jgi:hypothetical protein
MTPAEMLTNHEELTQQWMEDNYVSACPATNLLMLAEDGIITWEELGRSLLWYTDSHNDRDRDTVLMAYRKIASDQVDRKRWELETTK